MLSPTKPDQALSHTTRPIAPIIEDWVSDFKNEFEIKASQILPSFVYLSQYFDTAVRPVSAVVPKLKVTRPRLAYPIVTKSKSPIRRHITRSPSLKTNNSPPRVTAVQAPVVSAAQGMQGKWGNPQYALKDKGVIDSGCSRHMTRNILKVKVIKSDNGTEFKNNDLTQFCGIKGIKKEFSIHRTPHQNGIADRKNRTLIEAARTMLADLLLPIPFWDEGVNTACYVQNRVLVTKPHNKTPYELLHGRTPSISFMRPFGYPVTLLNTLDPLGKFEGKVDKGFLVGYSVNSSGPKWLFDIDSLTRTMNYQPVTARNQANLSVCFQDKFDAEKEGDEINQQYVLFPVWSSGSTNPQNYDGDDAFDGKEHNFVAKKPESEVIISPSSSAQSKKQDDKTKKEAKGKSPIESFKGYRDLSTEFEDCSDNSSNEMKDKQEKDKTGTKPDKNGEREKARRYKFDAEKEGDEINQQYVLFPVWSSGSTNPQNYDGDDAFDGKEHNFVAKKPESEVIISPSSSAQSRKQDDMTKKEAKGKSPIESFKGYRDLSTEFEDCSDNSSNEVNAAGSIVPTVGQIPLTALTPLVLLVLQMLLLTH
nr:putative ribonuclease H-like domain-containing protein [Tanacetum cinerariifolium]